MQKKGDSDKLTLHTDKIDDLKLRGEGDKVKTNSDKLRARWDEMK